MVPPCVKDSSRDGVPSTVVVKMQANRSAIQWASIATMPGLDARAVALVYLRRDIETESGVVYLVMTPANKGSTISNTRDRLKRKLETPSIDAKIDWIRPFDRRLQRLFGWGDCWIDGNDVREMIARDDKDMLTVCFPALKHMIANGSTEHLPSVAEGKQPLLCLTDGDDDYKERLYLDRELHGTHVYSEPCRNWECTICDRMPASRCACGAQRSKGHTQNHLSLNTRWLGNRVKAMLVHSMCRIPNGCAMR
jgi:hypothetical protein